MAVQGKLGACTGNGTRLILVFGLLLGSYLGLIVPFWFTIYDSSSVFLFFNSVGWEDHPSGTSTSTSTVISSKSTRGRLLRFHELLDKVEQRIQNGHRYLPNSAYSYATVVNQSTSWFQQRKICKETCCAETVAISLDQDDTLIINTIHGIDLADVRIPHFKIKGNPSLHSNTLNATMIPCLQPKTIIHLENSKLVLQDFFLVLRPNITAPYVLITSKSDADSPFKAFATKPFDDSDLLLEKWYGTNPIFPKFSNTTTTFGKFEPMPLGLSQAFHQEYYLRPYLELTNFTNPFQDKQLWLERLGDLDFSKHVFVHFGLRRGRRQRLWPILCPQQPLSSSSTSSSSSSLLWSTSTGSINCRNESKFLSPDKIYAEASKYLYGISPPGAGWDCYRTYELLLLGVIPIIDRRLGMSDALFEGLPVIQIPNLFEIQSVEDIELAIVEYISSEAFQNDRFDGWNRLFLRFWRRKVLKDSGRDGDILRDEQGREYYQAWKYTSVTNDDNLHMNNNDTINVTFTQYQ